MTARFTEPSAPHTPPARNREAPLTWRAPDVYAWTVFGIVLKFLGLLVKDRLDRPDESKVTPPPKWTNQLVIYEVNPYAFTSPAGPGSGTFRSLQEKLPYLEELGVTGIWLAGFSESTRHFYNIPSVYACRRPDRLDPRLGTEAEFRDMIDEAHRRGIRVFLDVISHGVTKDSPLVEEHPNWFRRGTWRMADFNPHNEEFRRWWVQTWTRYVLEFGVDGYRIDLGIRNGYELWDEITQRCREAGRPIVVFPEFGRYHFCQKDRTRFSNNLAGDFRAAPRFTTLQISSHDHGFFQAPGNFYRLRGSRARLAYDGAGGTSIPVLMAGEEFDAEQVSLPELSKGLYGGHGPGGWLYGSWLQWEQLEQPRHHAMLEDARRLLQIRREHADILHADRAQTHILPVACRPSHRPVPYARFLPGRRALIVVANTDAKRGARLTLDIPLRAMELDGCERYTVQELLTEQSETVSETELSRYEIRIPPDQTPRGGARILLIRPA